MQQGESRRLSGRDVEEGAVAVAARSSGPGRPVPQQQKERREWPSKLSTFFFFFIFLGAGVLVGVVASLHLMGILKTEGSSYFTLYSGGAPSSSTLIVQTDHLVQHNMDDEELLWRASMVPRRPGVPVHRTPKIAFMFLTVGRMPLVSVWEQFFHGHEDFYSVYVHSHPDYKPEVSSGSVFYGRNVPSQSVTWGEVSIVDAERRLLANALLDLSNERFLLLSETCIPLFNFTFIYSYISKSKRSFVASFDDPGPYGRARYNPNMMPEIAVEQWRKGGQWFEMARKLAIAVVSDVKYYPKFRDFCTPHCYIDEHYFQTMLSIEHGAALENRSLTYTDWSRGGSHPATFVAEEITDEFLVQIQSDRSCEYNGRPGHVCFLIARKFSESTAEPILRHSSYTRR